MPQGHCVVGPIARVILLTRHRLEMHEPLGLPFLPRLALRPSRHHSPPLANRPKDLVHRRLHRHLLPSHHPPYHHRPTQRPHAREIRLFHPKVLSSCGGPQCPFASANNRCVFFSLIASPYCPLRFGAIGPLTSCHCPVLRGWANYHRYVLCGETFAKLDNFVW